MQNQSLISISLDIKRGDTNLSTATGFLYKFETQLYLISNWHVFSGRNANNGQSLHRCSAIPDRFIFSLKHENDGWINDNVIELHDKTENVNWLQHQKGQEYDIAAIPVAMIVPERKFRFFCDTVFLNDVPQIYYIDADKPSLNAVIEPGMDLQIIGFPMGLAKQEGLPIWKRASIASEPELSADGLPIILVDTATREGMSGAPAYQYFSGTVRKKDGSTAVYAGGAATEFVGVYSGRYGAEDELAAQIGRVWKKSVLDEMLSDPAIGGYEIK